MSWKAYNAFLSRAKSKGIGHKQAQSLYRSVRAVSGKTPTSKDLTLFKGTKGKVIKGLIEKAVSPENINASHSATKAGKISHWDAFMSQFDDWDTREYESSADYGEE